MTKIRSVTPISVRYPEPNDNGALRHLTLCRVEADDGTVGWGEAVTSWPDACRATEAMIDGIGAELVVGRDPMDNVDVWRACRRRAWWYGNRGGISSFALSAIDIALWDLKGRLLGVPVTQLLGGVHHERLPAIASTHPRLASLEAEADRHAAYITDLGFRGCKLGLGKKGEARLGHEIARDVEFVGLLRDRVGPEPMVMWDRGVNTLTWDVSFAIRLTNALEALGLTWIEEPFEPGDRDSFRRLKRSCSTLVGSGEREWNVEGYREFIAARVADVIGFDPGRAEGITGGRRVIELVEEADAWFNAHAWSSAIVTAASLALSLTTPRVLVFELKPEENPMQHELVEQPIGQSGGWVTPLPGPGLGIEVREDVVERYRF
ncbi:MAG: mandelate racemase/muconate lactonizing enzyme family protein [Gaiellales bacterium]